MRQSLKHVVSVRLPQARVEETHSHLAATGRRGLEGMALWAGIQDGDTFAVEQVIIPKQRGLRTEHGLAVTVEGIELHRINMSLRRDGLRLIAQIHSHPTEAFHSAMDDEYAIATALGSLSVVVPDFAAAPFSIRGCAVYRLTEPGWLSLAARPKWRRVRPDAATRLIRVEH